MMFYLLNTNKMNVFQNCIVLFHEFFINQQVYVVYKIDCYDFYFWFVNQFQQVNIKKQIQYEWYQ